MKDEKEKKKKKGKAIENAECFWRWWSSALVWGTSLCLQYYWRSRKKVWGESSLCKAGKHFRLPIDIFIVTHLWPIPGEWKKDPCWNGRVSNTCLTFLLAVGIIVTIGSIFLQGLSVLRRIPSISLIFISRYERGVSLTTCDTICYTTCDLTPRRDGRTSAIRILFFLRMSESKF